MEILFIFLFLVLFFSFLNKSSRLLIFLLYLEVFSLLVIFFLSLQKIKKDYTLLLIILVLITCERAIGLSLLVLLVRKFSVDKVSIYSNQTCEGF